MNKSIFIWLCFMTVIVSCRFDDEPKLPSVDKRVADAIEDLTDELVAPSNGWRLNYRPTSETGTFFILMDFNEDGTVRIQSDVSANDGEFRDHVITYRIDSSQGLQLILETYGVFHYLFELEQNSFGAEFEFIFVEEDNGDLVFRSKTDPSSDNTTLIFEPAVASDSNLISTEAINDLNQGIFTSPNLGGIGQVGLFNFYVADNDHTISMVFDLDRRVAKILGAAVGHGDPATLSSITGIGNESAFSLSGEQVIFDQAQSFSFGGTTYSIGQIPIENEFKTFESFCVGQQDSIVNLSGTASWGDFTAKSSVFQTANNFVPAPNDVYGVNAFFVYDENDNSIIEQMENVFPDVVALQWYYELEIADSVFTGVGFVTVDEFNDAEFYLRGFDFTKTGNFFELTFNGNDLITDDNITQEEMDGLEQLTDLIFNGGEVYVIEIINQGGLFEFYNPCNKYKGFLL